MLGGAMERSTRDLLETKKPGFLWELLALAVCIIYDLYTEIPDRIRIAKKRHLEMLRTTVPEQRPAIDFSRTAIVAIYPSAESLPFTINLLEALRQSQFHIVVLSTRRLSADATTQLLMHCDHLIERRPIGRDFGSYQVGLTLLKKWGVYDRVDMLVLANDSMFYQPGFSSIVASIVDAPPTWAAIFENYEFHYHAQSFFQVFGRQALSSPAFDRFWAAYKPLSSRRYAIRKGEVGLTRAMRKAGFLPATYYTSNRIINAMQRWIADSNDLSPLHRVMRAQWGPAFTIMLESLDERGKKIDDQKAGPELDPSQDPLQDPYFTSQVMRLIGYSVERRNPTHLVGLLANFLCGAPIKRDLAYRGIVTMGEILQVASGYSDAQLAAMETDLRARGTPVMFRTFRKMLYYKGRL
jgi:hypothetical protein